IPGLRLPGQVPWQADGILPRARAGALTHLLACTAPSRNRKAAPPVRQRLTERPPRAPADVREPELRLGRHAESQEAKRACQVAGGEERRQNSRPHLVLVEPRRRTGREEKRVGGVAPGQWRESARTDVGSAELAVDVQDDRQCREPRRLRADAAPAIGARRAASRLEPHDGALGGQRHDPGCTQLGGLLHHQIHLLSLRHALDEHHVQPAWVARQRATDLELVAGDERRKPAALPVEHLDLRAGLEPQDGEQMTRLVRRQFHARSRNEPVRGNEEAMDDHGRASSIRSQPSRSLRAKGRSPCATYARSASSPWVQRRPERTSRPRSATLRAIAGASSSSVLRRMFAITIVNRPGTSSGSAVKAQSTSLTPFSAAPCRAASSATASLSVATTRRALSFFASNATTPLPVPTSTRSDPASSPSSSSQRSRQ